MPNIVVITHSSHYNAGMQRRQAFQYELKPDSAQQRLMRRYAGAKFIGYVAMAKHLTAWRNGTETPWLKDAPVHPLQHALKDLL